MSDKALNYAKENEQQSVEDLKALVRIPSVSFDGYDACHLDDSAAETARLLTRAGLSDVEIMPFQDGPPYVFAQHCHAPGKPTLLLYAHHDVQPPMRDERWTTPAFEPVERDGRLFGRGTGDDKAGIVIHTAALEAWLKGVGDLPINIKVIIEGEEEVGSPHLADFVAEHAEKLKADYLIVNDLCNIATGLPTLTSSLRGMISFMLKVSAIDAPLHSGMWSGPIPDPIMGMAKILSKLASDDGCIAVPGIYDDVLGLTDAEREDFASLPMDDELFKQQTGMKPGVEIVGDPDVSLVEKQWRLPSLIITSIEAGAGGIAGNVIMDSVLARVSLRLVPGMDVEKSTQQLHDYIREVCPWGLEIDFDGEEGAPAWMTDTSAEIFNAIRAALSEGYGNKAVVAGSGGSIPFVGPLTDALGGIPALLVGIEDPYTLAHSENESMHIGDMHKAIRSQILMFDKIAKL